ncbi:hypothetical protein A45J_0396 [hot springs metagenome]|uniref:Uncharacterized protein n=1 Tax=hot springs metagenome TaxID=433727 RepID=A0A5J4KSK5_9ZZZZ
MMKGKSYIVENRELAFKVYCEEGGNIESTLRRLEKEHGLKLSKPTFYDWMKKFNFKDRLKNIDAERQKNKDSQISFEEKMMSDLMKQKEKYEKYFDGIAGIDNQAQYAYTNIVKTIIELSRKIKPHQKETKDPAEMKRLAEEILESEYGIKR